MSFKIYTYKKNANKNKQTRQANTQSILCSIVILRARVLARFLGIWYFVFCFFNLPNGRKEECHQKQQDRRPSGWGKLQMQLQLRTASHLWGLQAML